MSASIARPVTRAIMIEAESISSNMEEDSSWRVALEDALSKVELVAAAQSRAYHSANRGCSRQSQTNVESQDLRRGKEQAEEFF